MEKISRFKKLKKEDFNLFDGIYRLIGFNKSVFTDCIARIMEYNIASSFEIQSNICFKCGRCKDLISFLKIYQGDPTAKLFYSVIKSVIEEHLNITSEDKATENTIYPKNFRENSN